MKNRRITIGEKIYLPTLHTVSWCTYICTINSYLTRPTCHGSSPLAAFVPPTILDPIMELRPQVHDPCTGGATGADVVGGGGGGRLAQAWVRVMKETKTIVTNNIMLECQ